MGQEGKVLSFEPEPENCRWLRKSIRANGYENVTLYEAALSETDGTARLYLGEERLAHPSCRSGGPSSPGTTKER